MKPGNFKDISNQSFGRLTAIESVGTDKTGKTYWLCKCSCSKEKTVRSDWLRTGKVKSCGCLNREMASSYMKEYNRNHKKHGKYKTRLHKVWDGMKQRCNNPNNSAYERYGGRGIKVCEEWEHDFQRFYEWAIKNGYDENAERGQCTLDRIDNNRGYTPDNCRFATVLEQANNKRNTRYVEVNGVRRSISEWARYLGVSQNSLNYDNPKKVAERITRILSRKDMNDGEGGRT